MKPSQFNKLERKALTQREEIIKKMKGAEKLGVRLVVEHEKEKLHNLVATMKNLKTERYATK